MRERRFWGAVLLLVALGALVSPRVVPLFDGVGFPDQPYRYVVPPPGAVSAPAPMATTATTAVAKGISTAGLSVMTDEQGPQLQMYIPLGGLAGAAGTITVTGTPEAPADQPPGATLDGNVYRVAFADSAGGAVTVAKTAASGLVLLRATSAKQPGPVFVYRPAATSPWQVVPIVRSGQDVYSTTFLGAGDYGLAFKPTGGGSGVPIVVIALAVTVVLLAAVIVLVRRRSTTTAGRS